LPARKNVVRPKIQNRALEEKSRKIEEDEKLRQLQ
jgi:hypothetical protein